MHLKNKLYLPKKNKKQDLYQNPNLSIFNKCTENNGQKLTGSTKKLNDHNYKILQINN